MKKTLFALVPLVVLATLGSASNQATDNSGFRVLPYLLNPSDSGMTVTWFSTTETPGLLEVAGQRYTSEPQVMKALEYSELEQKERPQFPDMFENKNVRHVVQIKGLESGKRYTYRVTQGSQTHRAQFQTAPRLDAKSPIRFVVLSDSETDPAGRTTKREWGNSKDAPAAQAPGSTGRPAALPKDARGQELYLATETEGYKANVRTIVERSPNLVLFPGDLVQGGGYQRAWDEFFFHNAGKFDQLFDKAPILPALGNWENFGARNGAYEPAAVLAARNKYKAYFSLPSNNNPKYKNQYYRIDYGPITFITLDSSNGLPDSTREKPNDADTQNNVSVATYPGDDLADYNPGSDQWNWAEAQLKDAHSKGQLIFVQWHHAPYSIGEHGFAQTQAGTSGQGGVAMRVYSPMLEKYGVVAVFSGHSELFERSLVRGIHYYDVGVAGDGLRGSQPPAIARRNNPANQWTAHNNEPELWNGNILLSGGKHYGHLEVNVTPLGNKRFRVSLTPVHVFPVANENFEVQRWERREYNDKVELTVKTK
ncbi:MAG: metallophosphoesterase [Deinococcales bacterium]